MSISIEKAKDIAKQTSKNFDKKITGIADVSNYNCILIENETQNNYFDIRDKGSSKNKKIRYNIGVVFTYK